MNYSLQVIINRLDGTIVVERDNVLRSKIKLLDAIAELLQKHESFMGSAVITVTVER
jgi:hypothetical protein